MAENRTASIDSKLPESKEEIALLAAINKNAKWKRKHLLMKEIEHAGLPSHRKIKSEKETE